MARTYFKAPAYFTKLMNESEKEAEHLLSHDRLDKAKIISDYAWARFRYEKIDIFKELHSLTWDKDKKIILVKRSGLKNAIKDLVDDIGGKLGL